MKLYYSLFALMLCGSVILTHGKNEEDKLAHSNSHEVVNRRNLAEDVKVEGKKKKKKGKNKKGKKKKGKKKKGKKNKKKKKTAPPTASPTKKPTANNVKVLVTYYDRFGLQTAMNSANIKVTNEDDSWDFFAAEMDPSMVKNYKEDEFVKYVDVDHDMQNYTLPVTQEDVDDNVRRLQEDVPWGITSVLQNVNFFNSQNVNGPKKVCVADTGYGLGHNDLPTEPDVTGKDATGDFNEAWDDDEGQHGTHCSGTVAAKGGNGKGVVGVIPNNKQGNFQLVIGKALSKTGSGSASSVMKAVQGCVDQGANVVSLSLGCNNCKTQTEDAFYTRLYEKENILLVAAAGNSGNSARSYPASYGAVMSVGAMTSSEKRSSFSQFNDQVEISAPGSGVRSTIPGNNFATWDGTSMATPHVAGVAGLLWMYFPTCKNYQIRNVINKSAKDIDSSGCEQRTGYGLVQAKDAYDLLLADGNCGENLGTKDPVGGCGQLVDQPGPTPTAPTPTAPTPTAPTPTAPTPSPNPAPYFTFPPTGTEAPYFTFPPTGTDWPTKGYGEDDYFYYDDQYYNDYYQDDYYQDDYYQDDYYQDNQDDNDNGNVRIEVVIGTDKYPSDTSWELFDSSGQQIMQGKSYKKSLKQFTAKTTAARGCYTFVINDVWGDGLCCQWGYGYYDLIYDGEYAVFDGGRFTGNSITEIFGDC